VGGLLINETIGFIGLGAMGAPISQNVLKKHYKLTVYDIVSERVDAVVKHGAEAATSSTSTLNSANAATPQATAIATTD